MPSGGEFDAAMLSAYGWSDGLTDEELLRGAEVQMPTMSMAFKQARQEQGDGGQGRLELRLAAMPFETGAQRRDINGIELSIRSRDVQYDRFTIA